MSKIGILNFKWRKVHILQHFPWKEIKGKEKEQFEVEAIYYNNCTYYDKGNSSRYIYLNNTYS